ncbi:hypothetical protein [Streptomyces sp. NPDC001530]|uniref:hypothetical protein n=1 Tax=Streptomyces sp. NPDC001530 TaxID=3364582 RepID=UPI0036CACD2D
MTTDNSRASAIPAGHAAMMHGLALEGAADLPVTVRTAGRSDGGDLLVLAEDPP